MYFTGMTGEKELIIEDIEILPNDYDNGNEVTVNDRIATRTLIS